MCIRSIFGAVYVLLNDPSTKCIPKANALNWIDQKHLHNISIQWLYLCAKHFWKTRFLLIQLETGTRIYAINNRNVHTRHRWRIGKLCPVYNAVWLAFFEISRGKIVLPTSMNSVLINIYGAENVACCGWASHNETELCLETQCFSAFYVEMYEYALMR